MKGKTEDRHLHEVDRALGGVELALDGVPLAAQPLPGAQHAEGRRPSQLLCRHVLIHVPGIQPRAGQDKHQPVPSMARGLLSRMHVD